ncbi:MAG: 1-acyl-sn-glycerol-3-phosphate acyltransferase [Candidatus Obscuribacterales bacterium]|nr:1-acyl-sn-glycerol-3-phosphate acyltransferase [Candidatus Obscuribacterales bacterium]
MNWLFQQYIRFDLALHNRVQLPLEDLKFLEKIPAGSGLILTPNHADETDFKVCVELSRRTARRFFYMMNREAFDEGWGSAGWFLRRLGVFSVERGGGESLEESKRYAMDIVERSKDLLVIFPEGEIFYLNDLVQPLKSGAVEIGMRAILENRKIFPEFTVFLVPMAIKYRYSKSISGTLSKRLEKIEKRLYKRVRGCELKMRVGLIIAELLRRQEMANKLKAGSADLLDLSQRVQGLRQSMMQELEAKYQDAQDSPKKGGLLERSWNLSRYMRSLPRGIFSAESFAQMKKDLVTLARVAQMASWQPEYVDLNPSEERLAETVLKLEREVFQIKRPGQLAGRKVYVRIGEPIDLSLFLNDYLKDPHAARHQCADLLRSRLQSLIDGIKDSQPESRGAAN